MNTAIRDISSSIRSRAMESQLLDRDHELRLARAWRNNGDRAARDELISAHQKLVMGMARKFERFNVPLADLFNQGMIALMVACEKYDPETGNRFATYAQWWVLTFLQEYVQSETCPVRIGKTRTEKAVFRALARARRRFGPVVSYEVKEKIAKEFKITVDDVSKIEAATGLRSLSLNQPVASGEDATEFIDTLVDEANGPDAMMTSTLDQTQQRVIRQIMEELEPREWTIIRDRFLSDKQKTLRALADELGISAERVRQIERESLRRMRQILENSGLTAEDIIGVRN